MLLTAAFATFDVLYFLRSWMLTTYESISKDPIEPSTKPPKIPHHVCIAIIEPEINLVDVAKLVVWAARENSIWVTVWDPQGQLKRESKQLEKAVANFQAAEGGTPVPFAFIVGGGFIDSADVVKVNILSLEDGRDDIVKAARSFSAAVKNGEASCDSLTKDTFRNWLTVQTPDFDLVLKFGGGDSLHGILPWQLRVSEIYLLKTHRNITIDEYGMLMQRFSGCSRRFGK